MTKPETLDPLAFRAFELLRKKHQVLVTSESCTAGLIAATLARVPGMSAFLAGGFVVYQVESKVTWLNVSSAVIEQQGVVSSEVAQLMVDAALRNTPHATIAISITGHLGPDAPDDLDGIAWLGFAQRNHPCCSHKLNLQTTMPAPTSPPVTESERRLCIRHERQQDAVRQSLSFLCKKLESFHEH
jgi:PncC family amidohydrolase